MEIRVTKADIFNGRRGYCSLCPVALAIKRATKKDVLVTGRYIRIDGNVYLHPPRVRNFIEDYDRGRPVKPFSFYLKEINDKDSNK